MFSLLKSIIWLVGAVVVAHFAMGFFGYAVNFDYFKESRTECETRLQTCRAEFFAKGYENPDCQFNCLDKSKFIIKKNQ
jgi:hypothetical protein